LQIKHVHIRNFRSLRDVELDELGILNIFVGRNSSGKSNLLEALCFFFNDFAIVGGNTAGLNEYHWFDKKTKNLIEFEVDIHLSDAETADILPQNFLKEIKKFGIKPNLLRIMRTIKNLQGSWETTALELSGLCFVKGDKQCAQIEIASAILGPVTDETRTTERPASVTMPSSDEFNKILTNISSMLKGKFKLISQIRDVKNPIVNRVTLVDSELQNSLWNLDQSIKSDEEVKCSEIEETFEKITGEQIDPAQGQAYIRRQGRRFPLNLEGGGIQASMQLIFSLRSDSGKYSFFGIEEPEAHSHPELQRRLFDELKSFADENSQIFVTTHSPTFVDRSDLGNVWVSKFMNGETFIKKADGLREVVEELGIRPSDVIFFANKILLVEGKSEALVLPAFARSLDVNIKDVAIIPVEGKSKARLNLKTWIEITRGVLPIYLVFDKDAEEELKSLKKEGLIESGQYHVWKEGSIESYYPTPLFQNALNELNQRYCLGMDVAAIMKRIEKNELQPDKIDIGDKAKLLNKTWKVLLAESVAKLIDNEKKTEISDEVANVLKAAAA